MSQPRHPVRRHLVSCLSVATADPADHATTISVLGPLRVATGETEIHLTSRRQRALLTLFTVNANTVVSAEALADQLWDGAPPPGALVTLRSYIFHLRKIFATETSSTVRLTTTSSGYRLEVDPEALDFVRFRRRVSAGHDHLRSSRYDEAHDNFDRALRLWRGAPLTEITNSHVAAPFIAELSELRTSAREARLRALVETGRHLEASPLLEALIAEEPLREGPYELLMLALYRSGRSGASLEVHRRFRKLLREQLGIDPSPGLDRMVGAILNRDPALELPVSGHAALVPTSAALAPPAVRETLEGLISALQTLAARATAMLDAMPDQPPLAVSSGALVSRSGH